MTATGGEDGQFLTSTKFFNLQYSSPNAGQTLTSLSIDLGSTGLFFNTNARTGFPMRPGLTSDGVQVTSSVSGTGSTILTLTITGLQPGGFMQFGIGRAQRTTRQDGISADLLDGAAVTATLSGPSATIKGAFANKFGAGYAPLDGYGLIDAVKAIKAQ